MMAWSSSNLQEPKSETVGHPGDGTGYGLEREVDHFIPWARYPDNGIHNFVVADSRCHQNPLLFYMAR